MVPNHDARSLVLECSAISVLGDPIARAAQGLKPDALVAVMTPLARFEPTPDGLVLTEISPGVTEAEIEQRTGFPVRPGNEVAERAPLSPAEAAALVELRAASARNRSEYGTE